MTASLLIGIVLVLGLLGLAGFGAAQVAYAAAIDYPACGAMQACIDAAADGDTINVAAGSYADSFTLNKAVSLVGAGADTTVFSALTGQRVITVTGAMISNTVVISGLTFTGGYVIGADGGAMLINGSAQPELNHLVFTNNFVDCDQTYTGGSGGAVYADFGSPVKLIAVSFISNTAAYGPGGGAVLYDAAVVSQGRFERNQAYVQYGSQSGGGLMVSGNLAMNDTVFYTNTASYYGGGLYASGPAVLTNTEFVSNTTMSQSGGGAYFYDTVVLNGGRFERNAVGADGSAASGGAAYIATGRLTLTGTAFLTNTAGWYGGALYIGYNG